MNETGQEGQYGKTSEPKKGNNRCEIKKKKRKE